MLPPNHMVTKEQKENISGLFNRIAPCYDKLNHGLSIGMDIRWRKKAVAALLPGTRNVLDVAAGTADLSVMLVKEKRASHVTGIDLSEGMLRIGRRKVHAAGEDNNIDLIKADAASLPFGDGTFDAVTCAFGVRNFSHLQEGLKEMCRVAAPGARLAILEFGMPGNKYVGALYNWYFTRVLPWIGGLVSKDKQAYSYLPASVKDFCYGQPFVELLQEAGFRHVKMQPVGTGICILYTAEK